MLRLQNVSLVRGVRVLYKNVNLTTSDGEIIGLVGPNGSGKSTLFAAILGELSTEDGDILAPPLNRISHVAQRVVETDLPALEYILEGHAPLMEAKAELKRAEEAGDDMAYAQAVAHLAEINEGAVVAKAEEILYGLGFKPNDSSRQVSEFSGGWRNRIALARALMRPADLLLLDEPTNHLDIDSVIWLESFLKQQEPPSLSFLTTENSWIELQNPFGRLKTTRSIGTAATTHSLKSPELKNSRFSKPPLKPTNAPLRTSRPTLIDSATRPRKLVRLSHELRCWKNFNPSSRSWRRTNGGFLSCNRRKCLSI